MAERRERKTGQKSIAEQQRAWVARGTESDLVYLAGFFDGEGSLGMYGRNLKLDVKVCGTDERPIRRFYEVFGFGTFSSISGSRTRYGRKPVVQWSCSGSWALLFLMTLLPHLVVKRAQAQEALRLRLVRRGVRIGADDLSSRREIAQRLVAMKKEMV